MRPERLLLAFAFAPLLASCRRGGEREGSEISFVLEYSVFGGFDGGSKGALVVGTEHGLDDWFAVEFNEYFSRGDEAYAVSDLTARRILRTVRRSGFFEWPVENPTDGGDPLVRRLVVLSPEAKHQVAAGGEKMTDLVDWVRRHAQRYGQPLDPKAQRETGLGSGRDYIHCASFDPKARLVATVQSRLWVGVWDAATGRKVGEFPVAKGGSSGYAPACVGFDPEAKTLASAERNGTVRLWDLETRQVTAALVGHKERVAALAFSPEGKFLATASEDSTLKMWDAKSGIMVASQPRQRFGDRAVAFSPDSQTLVIGNGNVELRRVSDWAKVGAFEAWGASCLAVSPGGRALAAGSEADWLVRVWWLPGEPSAVLCRGHIDGVMCLAFSPNGQSLASGSYDATAALWDARTGGCRALLWGHKGPVVAVAFSPDGKTLLSCGRDWTIRAWDASDARLLRVVNLGEEEEPPATLPAKGG